MNEIRRDYTEKGRPIDWQTMFERFVPSLLAGLVTLGIAYFFR